MSQFCDREDGVSSARCDNLLWLNNLSRGDGLLAKTMEAFRRTFNEVSQAESGDKTLRVDEEEFVISRHNGASMREQKYERHKDSYVRDKNNEIHGTSLRKFSLIIFLNDNYDADRSLPNAQKGMLRLYSKGESVEGVVDISPRFGRAVLFKSEEM